MGGAYGPGGGTAACGDFDCGGAGRLAVRTGCAPCLADFGVDDGEAGPKTWGADGSDPVRAGTGGREASTGGISSVGGAAAGPAPASVRAAPHCGGRAGRVPVVFSAGLCLLGFVDGPREIIRLCAGGSGVFCCTIDRNGSCFGTLSLSHAARESVSPLAERYSTDFGVISSAGRVYGVWNICLFSLSGY